MLKFLINVWLLGSGRKCTHAKLHEKKYAAWILVHTEKGSINFSNSVPLGSGFWRRMKLIRGQSLSSYYRPREHSRAEVEQIKKRSEALKRAREWDEAARKGAGE